MTTSRFLSTAMEAVWRRRNPGVSVAGATPRQTPHVDMSIGDLPRLAGDRVQLALTRRRDGVVGQPWITAESKRVLETMLLPTDVGIEFGSGGSTEWFARRIRKLYSVEASVAWYSQVLARLRDGGFDNVDLTLASAAELGAGTPEHREAFLGAHAHLEPGSVDFVFVDGGYRDEAAVRGTKLLRSGGLVVVDNAEAYLPSESRSPWHVDEPVSAAWREFTDIVAGWRHIWTTNGSWDTALWIKP